jgi:hypothetical protein
MQNDNYETLLADANCGDLAKASAARTRIAGILKKREAPEPFLRGS